MSEKINGILEIINSRRDTYGNCYFAFRYTDTASGNKVEAKTSGGDSNLTTIPYWLHGGNWEPRDIHIVRTELPIREYDRLIKSWPYAGCNPETLAAYIQNAVKQSVAA